MRHFYYLCFLLLGFLSLPVRAGGDNRAPEQYTREYIMKDYMKDPVRTLQLLDKAEVNSAMPLNIVDELRSAVFIMLAGLMSAIPCHMIILHIC